MIAKPCPKCKGAALQVTPGKSVLYTCQQCGHVFVVLLPFNEGGSYTS